MRGTLCDAHTARGGAAVHIDDDIPLNGALDDLFPTPIVRAKVLQQGGGTRELDVEGNGIAQLNSPRARKEKLSNCWRET